MHRARTISFVLLLTLVVFPVAVLTAQTNAMVYASGDVKLNGASVSGASTIFTGDRLVTSDSSIVSVNRSGSTVVVSPNSAIQYKASSVEVVEGTARVSTANGMSAQAGSVTITPQAQSAKFDVARTDKGLIVTSREGAVTVHDGGHTAVLPSGSSTTLPMAASKAAAFSSNGSLVASGPFYNLVQSDDDIPICTNASLCFRASVSKIRPCRCKPPQN